MFQATVPISHLSCPPTGPTSTHSVQVTNADFVPPAIRYAALVVSSDTSDVLTEGKRELDLAINDLHGDEVMLLIVPAIVEEKTIPLSCCKPEFTKFTCCLSTFNI